jgi:Aspartyl protease
MKFAARAALLCVLGVLPMGAAPTTSLSALLGHMRAINNGLYEAHIVSFSPRLLDGGATTLKSEVQGLRFMLSQCTGTVCLGTYFDGERLFAVNINGTALPRSPVPESLLRALRLVGTLRFISPDFIASGGTIYDGGYASFGGHRCRKIYVSDKIALPMIVYVDPQTWLVAGAQDVDGNATYAMRDYRKVGRFELPFEIDRNALPLEVYTSRAVAGGSLPIPHGISGTVTGTPAEMALDSQSTTPLGNCTIAGVSARCLIDSGNSAMAMSLELAEQIGLQPHGMLHVAGLGNYATEVVRAGPLQMGNVRFGDLNYIVLSDIHRYGYDVVVGADVLASMTVTIDNDRHAIVFGRSTTLGDDADAVGTIVPLAFQNFVPVVNVTLGDNPTALAIDTGDQSNINLAYEYYQRHPDIFKATKTETVSGVGGDSVELIGEIASVRIGSLTAQHQQIGATKTLKGTANGHLGAGFLSQYRIVLDYAHERMHLYPMKPL